MTLPGRDAAACNQLSRPYGTVCTTITCPIFTDDKCGPDDRAGGRCTSADVATHTTAPCIRGPLGLLPSRLCCPARSYHYKSPPFYGLSFAKAGTARDLSPRSPRQQPRPHRPPTRHAATLSRPPRQRTAPPRLLVLPACGTRDVTQHTALCEPQVKTLLDALTLGPDVFFLDGDQVRRVLGHGT
jgi:hypothetical protein